MSYQDAYATQEPDRVEVDARSGLLLLEFGASWCPHCIGAQPALQALLAEHDDVTHFKIEDGRGKPLGRSFTVKLWPTLVLLRDGDEVMRVVRPRSRSDLAPLQFALAS